MSDVTKIVIQAGLDKAQSQRNINNDTKIIAKNMKPIVIDIALSDKSAKASAAIFKKNFKEIEQTQRELEAYNKKIFNSMFQNANKSAKDSATVYKQAFKEMEYAQKQAAQNNKKFESWFISNQSGKSASQSASAFDASNAELFKTRNQQFDSWFSPGVNGASKSAKESASAFEDLFKNAEKSSVGLSNVEKQIVSLNPKINQGSTGLKAYGENLMMIGKKFADWLVIGTIFMQTIHQFQEMIAFTNELDKSITNIAMITGKSRDEINMMTRDYINLASALHDTTSSVMKASEEFLRAGHNQEETLKLIQSSTVMSKIAGQDQKQTADQLIAITNGYKMNIEQTMSVVDKLTTVDNNSATSTAELGSALERTSSSAQMAGVSFEKLVSYIATVSSVTRKSASSIGESFKTIFARMQDIKQGKKFDEEGESLSNVEKSLNKLGIALRSDAHTFRNMSDVLDELNTKWATLTQTQQADVAKSIAGVRQRENFLVLMSNYNQALQLEQKELNSSGSAMKRYGEYAKSTEAKLNDLTNAFQQLYTKILTSKTINSIVGGFTEFVTAIGRVIEQLGGLQTILLLVSSVGLVKFLSSLSSITVGAGLMEASLVGLQLGVGALASSLVALLANPVTWMIAATVAVVGGITMWANSQQKLKEQTIATSNAQKDFNASIKEFQDTLDPQKLNDSAQALERLKKAVDYDEATKNIKELETEISNIQERLRNGTSIDTTGDQMAIVYKQEELNKLKDSIKQVEEAQKKQNETQELANLLDYKSTEQKARSTALTLQQANSNVKLVESYKAVYDKLVNGVALTEQETELNNQLLQQYPEHNKLLNEKTGAMGLNYDALKRNMDLQQAFAVVEFNTAQASAKIQLAKTNDLISQTDIRIAKMTEEINVLRALTGEYLDARDRQVLDYKESTVENLKKQNVQAKLSASALSTIVKAKPSDFIKSSSSRGGYIPPNSSKSSGVSSSRVPSSVSEALIEKDRYAQLNGELEKTSVLLEKNKALQENTEGAKKNSLLKDEIKLLKVKQNNLKAINDERRKERDELSNKNGILSRSGVKFTGTGDSLSAINAQEILNKKLDQVNARRNDKDKAVYNKLKSEYDSLSKALSRFVEIQTKDIPNASKDWYELQKQVRSTDEELKKIAEDKINSYQNYLIEGIEKQINKIEDAKKAAKESSEEQVKNLQTEIDSLEKKNEEIKEQEERERRLLEIQKQKEILSNTENERNVKLFQNGQWNWVADPRAVREERQKLADMQTDFTQWDEEQTRQAKINDIQEEIKTIQESADADEKAYDRKIEKLRTFVDEAKTKYEEQKGEIQSYTDLMNSLTGIEKGIYAERLSALDEFIADWNAKSSSMKIPGTSSTVKDTKSTSKASTKSTSSTPPPSTLSSSAVDIAGKILSGATNALVQVGSMFALPSISSVNSKSSSVDNSINIQKVEVKADNPTQFLKALNNQISNLVAVRG